MIKKQLQGIQNLVIASFRRCIFLFWFIIWIELLLVFLDKVPGFQDLAILTLQFPINAILQVRNNVFGSLENFLPFFFTFLYVTFYSDYFDHVHYFRQYIFECLATIRDFSAQITTITHFWNLFMGLLAALIQTISWKLLSIFF